MTSEHPFAVGCLAVMLLLSVAAFPPCVGATSRIMPAAISATGMLRTPRVPQSPVRQLRQVYAPPEQVSESMSQFRAADAALLKRIADGQAEARVEYVNVMKGKWDLVSGTLLWPMNCVALSSRAQQLAYKAVLTYAVATSSHFRLLVYIQYRSAR